MIKQSKLLKIKSRILSDLFKEKYGLKLGEFNNTTESERVNTHWLFYDSKVCWKNTFNFFEKIINNDIERPRNNFNVRHFHNHAQCVYLTVLAGHGSYKSHGFSAMYRLPNFAFLFWIHRTSGRTVVSFRKLVKV